MDSQTKLDAQSIIINWKKQGGSIVRLRNMIAEALEQSGQTKKKPA